MMNMGTDADIDFDADNSPSILATSPLEMEPQRSTANEVIFSQAVSESRPPSMVKISTVEDVSPAKVDKLTYFL